MNIELRHKPMKENAISEGSRELQLGESAIP